MSTATSPSALAAPTLRSNVRGIWKTMRPRQWVKNVIIFAALVFDGKLLSPEPFLRTVLLFLLFCFISSSVYIMNDLVDIEKDRTHPRKRLRPLPAGTLSPAVARLASLILALLSVAGAFMLDVGAGIILLAYFAQNVAYSFWLKNIVIVDVMVLALGFLLRVAAGVVVVNVTNFSPWLYICVTLLALFLGFGKRRHEITLLEEGAGSHRASLQEYNLALLDQIMGLVTTSTLITYTFYSFDASTALAHSKMLFTVPFVFYFIARYLYLIHVKKLGGAPDELLLQDRPLLINSALWAASVVFLIYVWR